VSRKSDIEKVNTTPNDWMSMINMCYDLGIIAGLRRAARIGVPVEMRSFCAVKDNPLSCRTLGHNDHAEACLAEAKRLSKAVSK
jgi:hypothetical protein